MVCLDSGALDTERLWITTSLRGLAGGVVTVQVLDEGVHSGDASGVVPSSFRIIRQLLDRVEDAATGAGPARRPARRHPDRPARRGRGARRPN